MCHLKVGFQVHNWVHQGFAAGGNLKILTFQKYLTVKGQETKVMLILMVVNSDVHTHGYVWIDGLPTTKELMLAAVFYWTSDCLNPSLRRTANMPTLLETTM